MSLKEFNIHFGRLTPGKHEFNFSVDKEFFAHYDYDVAACSTKTQLVITKTSAVLMTFEFSIAGTMDLPCDRCIEVLPYPIEGQYQVLVKLENQDTTVADEIIYLSPDAYEINVADTLYEFHILSIPLKTDCTRRDHIDCQKINDLLLGSSQPDIPEDDGDPRWNDLKKLL